MPTQADYDKVKTTVIDPLRNLYGAEINDYAADAMVEDLARFDKPTLEQAMLDLRRSSKRAPTLALIFEACRGVRIPSAARGSSPHEAVRLAHIFAWKRGAGFQLSDEESQMLKDFETQHGVITMEAGREDYRRRLPGGGNLRRTPP